MQYYRFISSEVVDSVSVDRSKAEEIINIAAIKE